MREPAGLAARGARRSGVLVWAGALDTRAVRYAILGPLEVSDRIGWSRWGRKERVLLAVLLACRRSVVPAGELIDALWDAAALGSARRTLAAHVTRLRAVLEADRGTRAGLGVIRTAGAGWRLDVGRSRWTAEGSSTGCRLAAAALREGRFVEPRDCRPRRSPSGGGAAYDGFCWVDICLREAARLGSLRAAAIEDTAEPALALRRARELISELELALSEEPLRERRWALPILALYRAGRRAGALGAYHSARAALRDEVGVDPGAELQRLHQGTLEQVPWLLAPMAGPATALAPGCPFKGLAAYAEADAARAQGPVRPGQSLPPQPEPHAHAAPGCRADMTLPGTCGDCQPHTVPPFHESPGQLPNSRSARSLAQMPTTL
jgi:DNA-binding SARP family transcriptional activator